MAEEFTPPPPYYDNEERKSISRTEEIPDDKSSQASPRTLKTFGCLSGLNRAVGALLIILVIVWIYQNRGGFSSWLNNGRFNWHPMLMTLGMVFLYSNGMLIYRTHRNNRIQRLNALHAGIMVICMACTIAGLVIGFDSHWEGASTVLRLYSYSDETRGYLRIPEMYTLHSWVGLISVILFFCQCTAGFVLLIYPGIKPHLRAKYERWYLNLGTGSFGGGVVASLLGFNNAAILDENSGRNYGEHTLIWFIYLTLIAFGGLSLYLLSQDRFKRLARPGDDEPMSAKTIFGELLDGDEEICCLPWTPNDCVRSARTLFDEPIHSDPIIAQTVQTQSPPPSVIKD